MTILTVFLLIISQITSEDRQSILKKNYCEIFCENETHIVCERAGRCPITIANCKSVTWDASWRLFLLKKHNRLRDTYAKINLIGNMQVLNYDLELEYIAMCFANTCPERPEPCMATNKFQSVGQNAFRRDLRHLDGDIDAKWRKHPVNLWYEEGYGLKVVPDSTGRAQIPDMAKYGNLVRMVWPLTTHIGCAKSKNKDNFYFFCNYGPSLEPNSTFFFKTDKACGGCINNKCNFKYWNSCGVFGNVPEEVFHTTSSTNSYKDFHLNLGLILLCLMVVISASNLDKIVQKDFCRIFCDNTHHVVCERQNNCSTLSKCSRIPWGAPWRQFILDKHNKVRNEFAKKFQIPGMQLLRYDLELEYVAMCWANTCPDTFDLCRSTHFSSNIGQNVYKGLLKDFAADKSLDDRTWRRHPIQMWMDEGQNLNFETINKDNIYLMPNLAQYRRMAQLVNPGTTHLGCGKSFSKTLETQYLVCNYAPSLDFNGTIFSLKEVPCKECEDGCNKKYQYLCGNEGPIPEDIYDLQSIACHLQPLPIITVILFVLL